MAEELPPGFLKLADELSLRASSESDPALKKQMLESAERFRRLDEQARSVLAAGAALGTKVLAPRGGSIPEAILYVVVIAFMWLLAFLRSFESGPVAIAGVFSSLLLFAWYFESRNVGEAPSRLEKTCAWLWLVLRTVVGIVGGLVFLGLPIALLVLDGANIKDGGKVTALLISLTLGALCIWVGFVGWSRNPVRDLQLRKERKRKYGWRF